MFVWWFQSATFEDLSAKISHIRLEQQVSVKIKAGCGSSQNYFIPGVVKGTVTNTLGDQLKNIQVKIIDGLNSTTTNCQGSYTLSIPASTVDIVVGGEHYKIVEQNIVIARSGEFTHDVILEPQKIGIIYRIRLILQNLKKRFFDTTNLWKKN